MNALLDAAAVRAACAGGLWSSVSVVPVTGSTNTDLLRDGGPEGQVLVAEEQTAGRGRLGRSWQSQPGTALTFSVLLRPDTVPPARQGWLPLIAGVAVATAVRAVSGLGAALKWPNDVLIGDRKLAGILAEQASDGDAAVIGIGLNVATPADALPGGPAGPGPAGPTGPVPPGPGHAGPVPAGPGGLRATSLLAEGAARVKREPLLIEVLRQLEVRYLAFHDNPDPDAIGLRAEYRALCGTLGRRVRVELPAGQVLEGIAQDVDAGGRLLIAAGTTDESGASTPTPISAGDVIHLR